MSVGVETFGTGKVSNNRIIEIIRENFELQPTGIIEMLNLRQPIYKKRQHMDILVEGTVVFRGRKLIRQK